MIVTLTTEHERIVGEAINAGLIGTAEDIVNVGVETIRQRLESRTQQSRQKEIDDAADRLLKFGEKYHLSLGGLTIEELINEGRR